MHNYDKVWISEAEYRIRQIRDDGMIRFVDDDYEGYVQWLAAGNVPEELPYVMSIIKDTKQSSIDKIKSLIRW